MHWKLIVELTFSQIKARYRRTLAGFLWVVLNPIIMYGAQALVFKNILKITVPNYTLFLLGGLLPWIFIVSSLDMGIPVLQNSRELLIAFKLHPLVLIVSSILDNWINFLASFLLVLFSVIFLSTIDLIGLLFIPLAIVQLLLGIGGLVWLLAVLNVFYRDTRYVVHFAISVLFFLTPIFYPKEFIPQEYQWLLSFNFLYVLIEPIRQCIYQFSVSHFMLSFAKGMMTSILLVIASYFIWKRTRNEFYYYL